MTVLTKCFSIGLLLCLTISSLAYSVGNDSIPYGKWRIYKYKVGQTPAGLSQEDVNKLIGKYITLSKTRAVFVKDSCKSPMYKTHWEGDEYFTNMYKTEKSFLGIKADKVKLLSVGCDSEPIYSSTDSPNFSYEFIITSKTTMIVNVMGVYFYLQKAK